MKVYDGIRAWSIILYRGKPYIVLRFTTLTNRSMRIEYVRIARWNYSINASYILSIDFDDLKEIDIRYNDIEECEVLLSW